MSSPFVFLIGAGASKPMGIPIMKEFRKEFEKYCKDKPPLNNTLQKLLSHDKKQDLEDMLINIHSLSFLKNSIEAKILIDEIPPIAKSYFKKEASRKMTKKKVTSKMKKDVTKFTNKYHKLEIEALNFINERCLNFKKDKAKAAYEKILTQCLDTGVKIFTTNYDPILEEICKGNHSMYDKYADGFFYEPLEDMKVWDFTLNQFDKKPIDIYKLHGSVTWYRDQSAEKIVQLPIKLGEGAQFKGGKRMYHLLIYPASMKDIYSYPFFNLYLEFLKILENTQLIIAIGHSFRDPYIRAAIENRLKDNKFTLILISPSALSNRKDLSSIFSNNKNVIPCPYKFEDFTSKLMEFLQDYQKEEINTMDNLRKEMDKEAEKIYKEKKKKSALKKSKEKLKTKEVQPPQQVTPLA